MKFNQYKFKFYLNGSHSIYLEGEQGQPHPHTWEITIDIIKAREDFVQFNVVEKSAEQLLAKYQDCYLNDVEPFDTLNPILENICEYFRERFSRLLLEKGWILLRIEISETPARSYIIDMNGDDALYRQLLEETVNDEELAQSVDEAAQAKLDKITGLNKP